VKFRAMERTVVCASRYRQCAPQAFASLWLCSGHAIAFCNSQHARAQWLVPVQVHHGLCDAVCGGYLCDEGPARCGGRHRQRHRDVRHALGRAHRVAGRWAVPTTLGGGGVTIRSKTLTISANLVCACARFCMGGGVARGCVAHMRRCSAAAASGWVGRDEGPIRVLSRAAICNQAAVFGRALGTRPTTLPSTPHATLVPRQDHCRVQ
jgi:hypothetical protein